jgi:hypothetical protein
MGIAELAIERYRDRHAFTVHLRAAPQMLPELIHTDRRNHR